MRSWKPAMLVVGGGAYTYMERGVMLGAHACARAHGWSAVAERGNVEHLERWISEWRPRSVLMLFSEPAAVAKAMAAAPTVAALSYTDGLALPAVDVDQGAVARAAADYLMGLGFRHFGVFGTWSLRWAVDRARAFERYVEAAGFDCNTCSGKELTQEPMLSTTVSHELIGQWIESLPKPVGILACYDVWGMHLVNHCRALGVRVPEDAAIVSVDNDEMVCEMSNPPLSSVAVNWRQIGYDAAALAGKLAEGKTVEPIRRLVAPAGVVARQSSDLSAVDEPDVAAALGIIRQHADRPLTVKELLRKIPVFQHRLEQRFRDRVGRRILQEIRRVHVEQAKRLLVSTDLQMPEIAERSGFANAAKLAIAFRQETGQTATAFRGQFRLRP